MNQNNNLLDAKKLSLAELVSRFNDGLIGRIYVVSQDKDGNLSEHIFEPETTNPG